MGYRPAVGTFSAALIVASMGQIAPAHANEQTDNVVGTYRVAIGDPPIDLQWAVSPCNGHAPKCITVRQVGGGEPWTGNAAWTVGSWTMTVPVPGVMSCADGSKYTLPTTFAWDDATGKGFRTYTDPGSCSEKSQQVAVPFTLTKIGPTVPAAPPQPPAPAPAAAPAESPVPGTPESPVPGTAEAPAAPVPAAVPAPLGAAESMAPPPAA